MKKNHTDHKQGYMLVTILLLITVLSIGLASLITVGSQQTFTARRMSNKTKALAYAEAGVEYAFSILKEDFMNKEDINNFIRTGGKKNGDGNASNPYGFGNFTLTISAVGENDRYCIVRSTGECNGYNFTAEVVAEDKLAGEPEDSETTGDPTEIVLPNIPVVSNGSYKLGGDVYVSGIDGSTPSIHSNTSGNVLNKQAKEDYFLTTTGNWTGKTPKNGQTGYPEQQIPAIPLEVYEAAARTIDAGEDIPNSVSGGILYIDNPNETETEIDLGGLGNIQATIILAEGLSVRITQGTTLTPGINPDNGQPYALSIVPKGGNFTLRGGDITGLLYLPNGNFTMSGNPKITGQILINGDTTWTGTPDAFVYSETILNPPTVTPTTTTRPQDVWIGAWQK